jgi:hypothetical protein
MARDESAAVQRLDRAIDMIRILDRLDDGGTAPAA